MFLKKYIFIIIAQTTPDPFDDSASPNPYTPPLSEPFVYGEQMIRGVNLGGWLVIEPFITPSLFDQFPASEKKVVDEWTLCERLGPEEARRQLETHYDTFVVEHDFELMAQMGLNHVRIPIGHWAVLANPDEPYVGLVAWDYLIKGIQWARKYGLRVMVELHTAPGSQNGWNHSGRQGTIGWLNGTQGVFNADRTLAIVEAMARHFSDPEWSHAVPLFGVLNEPAMTSLKNHAAMMEWYHKSYDTIRNSTGDNGPTLSYHDGFLPLPMWSHFFENTTRVILETHLYLIFDQGLVYMPREVQAEFPCGAWRKSLVRSMNETGPTMVGEFSVATNDCGKYLNGIGHGNRYEGTDNLVKNIPVCKNCTCVGSEDWKSWTDEYKQFLKLFAERQMDAYESGIGWFFWTYKTENHVNPHWDYLLGWKEGWLPLDANKRVHSCSEVKIQETPTASLLPSSLLDPMAASTEV
ncbi:glycoside hydrolase family 5 protein [Phycomyces blakesleeanus NRRL 1555(-)]|uniref:glucan 1,3-beta-glucosidase n=1 Tax=Phycomyces blakesleeanus (strain ATCC 8743b / DSM 1359 / FGSC 10004 / NBRC 33097 / NRRL 1555) TaxID=763407 RepID=A0A162U3E4_PHYB8|nr:glycoside hydrolase family 5 protein [Phycomyces blakesleeanus NRRL 1555(-)]OAD72053.1 glycoside hydrolase family 5 protein [Phycomyces blakesleeanus NRRL 1555(-)]|eukprot:XP_018290093.1 glycoside hydrolase family 5 protein [Phycomyces blakesleeanus NRRL 1555(-)]